VGHKIIHSPCSKYIVQSVNSGNYYQSRPDSEQDGVLEYRDSKHEIVQQKEESRITRETKQSKPTHSFRTDSTEQESSNGISFNAGTRIPESVDGLLVSYLIENNGDGSDGNCSPDEVRDGNVGYLFGNNDTKHDTKEWRTENEG